MKTSRILSVTAFVLMMLTAVPAGAQGKKNGKNPEEWREKMKAEKVAYITSKVNLSVEEAQKFWPVYNEVSERRSAAFAAEKEAFRMLKAAVKENDEAKIAQALKTYTAAVDSKDKLIGKDVEAFRKVLPEAKVAKIILAEEEFRRDQIARLHKGKSQDKGKGRNQGKKREMPQAGTGAGTEE